MQLIEQTPDNADTRFAKALALFRLGSLKDALSILQENEADDRWFVRAYPYLHEIRLALIAQLSPKSTEWQQIKQADKAASDRLEHLHEDSPSTEVSEDDDLIRGAEEHHDFHPDAGGGIAINDDLHQVEDWRNAQAIPDSDDGVGGGGFRHFEHPRSDVRGRREWFDSFRRRGLPQAAPEPKQPPPAGVPVVERTPHIGISSAAPLQPGMNFEIEVYLDSSAPLKGEHSQPVIAAPGSTVVATIFTSSHFQVKRDANVSFVLNANESRITLPLVSAFVTPMESWSDGIAFVGVTFFVDGRPSGQITRQVEVLGRVETVAAPSKSIVVIAASGGPIADLTVTIVADPSRDGRSFWCFVSTPHIEKYRQPVTGPWNLQSATQQLVSGFMARFTAVGTPRGQLISELKGVGVILFDSSPDIFREVFWALIDESAPLKTIAIVTAEPFVPWELMIPNRSMPSFVRRLPLGVEFNIGRWTDEKTVAPSWSLRIVDSSVIAPAYGGTMTLKNSLLEANMVTEQYPGTIIRPALFATVGKELGTVPRSLIHFVCHGRDTASGIQCIKLDNNEELSSANILGIEGLGELFAETRPVVFLNACEIGRTTPSLVGLGGFVASFIKLGATAVIAPLWSVEDSIAHEIATLFYQEVKSSPDRPLSRDIQESASARLRPEFRKRHLRRLLLLRRSKRQDRDQRDVLVIISSGLGSSDARRT